MIPKSKYPAPFEAKLPPVMMTDLFPVPLKKPEIFNKPEPLQSPLKLPLD